MVTPCLTARLRRMTMPAQSASELPAAKTQLSLHVRHPSLAPEEISQEMRWQPVESFAVGQPCKSSTSIGLPPRLHSESYWVATLDVAFFERHRPTGFGSSDTGLSAEMTEEIFRRVAASESPEQFVTLACSSLLRHTNFFQRIRSTGGSAKLVVTMAEPTLRLPPEVSRRLADLGIALEAEFVSR
jgi:hypothetical protein